MVEVVGDEQAKAIQEVSKTVRELPIKELGAWIGRVFGTPTENAVGLLGADWLAARRAENIITLRDNAMKRLKDRGITDPTPVSPRLALPFLRAAADESDPTLQELWARLMANAMDPTKPDLRQIYIETVRQFEPLDYKIFTHVGPKIRGRENFTTKTGNLEHLFGASNDQIRISLDHLTVLQCHRLKDTSRSDVQFIGTALGRELYRTISIE